MKVYKLSDNIVYNLKKDETIEDVMMKFNTTMDNIEKYVISNEYFENEPLIIKHANSFTHCVKPMESLDTISKKYGVSKDYIIKVNNLKSSKLFIGQKLFM